MSGRRYVLEAPQAGAVPLSFSDGAAEPPFSIGRRGDWRINGQRVLDVHAFFLFDGRQAFARSAVETDPAGSEGGPLPTSWVPLQLPCRIFVGDVVAIFRLESAAAVMGDRRASAAPAPLPSAPAPSLAPAPAPVAPPAPPAPAPARSSRALGRAIAGFVLVCTLGVAGFVLYKRQHRPPPPEGTSPVVALPPEDPPEAPLGIVTFPSPPIAAAAAGDGGVSRDKDAGAPQSLQRVAVDALHRGDVQAAAAAYETLAAQHPENPAFARAARTLRK